MTTPSPDLVRAVRKGCDTAWPYGPDHPCIFPECTGCKEGTFLRAALAELAEPSEAMMDAIIDPLDSPIAGDVWRTMMRKVVEEKP